MDLFDRQGYTATTVAQIADAAQVSHTTFFRYFQSKEQVVLQDDLDEQRVAILQAIPPGLSRFDLLRRIVTDLFHIAEADEWASDPRRSDLLNKEPELMVAFQNESDGILAEARGFIADYLDVPADDLRLRVFIAAAAGVMFHVTGHTGEGEMPTLEECIEAIDLLEAGLPV